MQVVRCSAAVLVLALAAVACGVLAWPEGREAAEGDQLLGRESIEYVTTLEAPASVHVRPSYLRPGKGRVRVVETTAAFASGKRFRQRRYHPHPGTVYTGPE